jgi:hypothetical protein
MFRPPPPPPSPRIIDAFREALKHCMTLEIAATQCKIPQKTLLEWIKYGRRGAVEYMPFVDMIDEENAELSGTVLSFLYRAAFTEANLDAVKFIYKHRLQKNEERFQARIHEIEDRIQEETVEVLDAKEHETELAAAELRLAKH